jgi:outer membrane receptor protein involved in Fe transport
VARSLHRPDPLRRRSGDQRLPGCGHHHCPDRGAGGYRTGAYTYHNLQFGYNIEPIHTTLEVGVDNVFDKQAPVLWQYGFNGNTDERTYDTMGRYYWMRAGVKF